MKRRRLQFLAGLAAAVLIVPIMAAARAARSAADPVPFTSNGCSGFREGKFSSCCFVHDFDFWAGGTKSDRRRADSRLKQCLIDVTRGNLYDRIVANIAFLLMVLERVPGRIIDDGWGRGWPDTKRGKYDALSPEQKALVDGERRRVCRGLNLDASTGMYRVNDDQKILPAAARSFCGELLPAGVGGG